jgi:hypothetical protein
MTKANIEEDGHLAVAPDLLLALDRSGTVKQNQ